MSMAQAGGDPGPGRTEPTGLLLDGIYVYESNRILSREYMSAHVDHDSFGKEWQLSSCTDTLRPMSDSNVTECC